jgi:hypothetical protein
MKVFGMFIWICCIVFIRSHALNIRATELFYENDSNGTYRDKRIASHEFPYEQHQEEIIRTSANPRNSTHEIDL